MGEKVQEVWEVSIVKQLSRKTPGRGDLRGAGEKRGGQCCMCALVVFGCEGGGSGIFVDGNDKGTLFISSALDKGSRVTHKQGTWGPLGCSRQKSTLKGLRALPT